MLTGSSPRHPSEGQAGDTGVCVNWRTLQEAVCRWLRNGDVRPYLHVPWKKDEAPIPSLRLGTSGESAPGQLFFYSKGDGGFLWPDVCPLFGALASVLLVLCCRRGSVAFCAECQGPFIPKTLRQKYCPRHSNEKTWNRLAQQRRRASRRAARSNV